MMQVDTQLLKQLSELLAQTSLNLSQQQIEKLVMFVQLMDKWNKAYNLTSVRDPSQMLVKHIVDSVVVAPFIDKKHYIDVGTGPGLPGIPLAIVLPDTQFILLDSLGKRVRFMRQVAFELGLKNIEPVQSRVEDYQPQISLNGVISRAFASIKDMLHWCEHLVDSSGTFLALKGQYPEQELAELPNNFVLKQGVKLQVPGLEGDRHLILLSKK
ncbi:16S rRNA (guanine(527)-N(7))-methyltransferase RsmG [Neptunicella marina]|uniref:Ribosomal RNA small subunit methyltransferase G n=1 Tax=Neptunicella marina TaxID=2125989 RepID=A0A8J6IUN4_9ALTE|nr:16S rRNA (guanine(527)-N(7))-methyltransferase RsmG [Neptunicella marina]MBC3766649.1 16S rRNA (guanine(527)-N(7))-methyltransferase RsmG [Neptunicella marina]